MAIPAGTGGGPKTNPHLRGVIQIDAVKVRHWIIAGPHEKAVLSSQ